MREDEENNAYNKKNNNFCSKQTIVIFVSAQEDSISYFQWNILLKGHSISDLQLEFKYRRTFFSSK